MENLKSDRYNDVKEDDFLDKEFRWSMEDMLEVKLESPDDFLVVKETLSRIGVAAKNQKKLWQSCHILHKRGNYYIVSFLELFALDGKETTLTNRDIARRNVIAKLLEDWGLVKIVDRQKMALKTNMNQIKVVPFKEKKDWVLSAKYQLGTKKKEV